MLVSAGRIEGANAELGSKVVGFTFVPGNCNITAFEYNYLSSLLMLYYSSLIAILIVSMIASSILGVKMISSVVTVIVSSSSVVLSSIALPQLLMVSSLSFNAVSLILSWFQISKVLRKSR